MKSWEYNSQTLLLREIILLLFELFYRPLGPKIRAGIYIIATSSIGLFNFTFLYKREVPSLVFWLFCVSMIGLYLLKGLVIPSISFNKVFDMNMLASNLVVLIKSTAGKWCQSNYNIFIWFSTAVGYLIYYIKWPSNVGSRFPIICGPIFMSCMEKNANLSYLIFTDGHDFTCIERKRQRKRRLFWTMIGTVASIYQLSSQSENQNWSNIFTKYLRYF